MRVSLRWPAAVSVSATALVAGTATGLWPPVTVTLAIALTLAVLAVWRPE